MDINSNGCGDNKTLKDTTARIAKLETDEKNNEHSDCQSTQERGGSPIYVVLGAWPTDTTRAASSNMSGTWGSTSRRHHEALQDAVRPEALLPHMQDERGPRLCTPSRASCSSGCRAWRTVGGNGGAKSRQRTPSQTYHSRGGYDLEEPPAEYRRQQRRRAWQQRKRAQAEGAMYNRSRDGSNSAEAGGRRGPVCLLR